MSGPRIRTLGGDEENGFPRLKMAGEFLVRMVRSIQSFGGVDPNQIGSSFPQLPLDDHIGGQIQLMDADRAPFRANGQSWQGNAVAGPVGGAFPIVRIGMAVNEATRAYCFIIDRLLIQLTAPGTRVTVGLMATGAPAFNDVIPIYSLEKNVRGIGTAPASPIQISQGASGILRTFTGTQVAGLTTIFVLNTLAASPTPLDALLAPLVLWPGMDLTAIPDVVAGTMNTTIVGRLVQLGAPIGVQNNFDVAG